MSIKKITTGNPLIIEIIVAVLLIKVAITAQEKWFIRWR
jgi:hypothetical protein